MQFHTADLFGNGNASSGTRWDDSLLSKKADFEGGKLRQILLKDLTVTPCQVRNGTYIKLKISTEGVKMSAFTAEALDSQGKSVRLAFYNLPSSNDSNEQFKCSLNKTFFVGRDILIKDPWFKFTMDGGTAIRVESSKDIAFVDVNATPPPDLISAIRSGNIEECTRMLSTGLCEPIINIPDKNGTTPFNAACYLGHVSILTLMISQGAKINEKDQSGVTSLLIAVVSGHFGVSEFLLSKDIDVNAKKYTDGSSPLHLASAQGYFDIAALLVSNGANIHDRQSSNGCTSLMLASDKGFFDIVDLLLSKGARINEKTNEGYSSIMFAARSGHLTVVEFLLSKGASLHFKSVTGENCYSMAANKKVRRVLRKWPVTMIVLFFQELLVYHQLDDSLIDFYEYFGEV